MQHVLDYRPEQINVLPIDLGYLCIPGSLDHRSGAFVLACLERGVELCLNGNARALVTGPIQKSVVSQSFLNSPVIPSGLHTEPLAVSP